MRNVRWGSVTAGAVLPVLLSGCMFLGDPPPEPNVPPIEVVAKPDSCLLNRDSVAAGTHDVAVIMEQGSGRVRILRDNMVVFERPMGGPSRVSEPTPVVLPQGGYLVECQVDGQISTANLSVTA